MRFVCSVCLRDLLVLFVGFFVVLSVFLRGLFLFRSCHVHRGSVWFFGVLLREK